jgi:general secretion pathway protein L
VTLVILLDNDDAADLKWLRVDAGQVVARGERFSVGEDVGCVAVAPPDAVALRWIALPGAEALSPPQLRAAVALRAPPMTYAPIEAVHVATAPTGDEAIVAMTDCARITRWLNRLAAHGLDAHAIIPAALLLPLTDTGLVSGDFGNGKVLRGPTTAFADDAVLTPLLAGGTVVLPLSAAQLEAALINAVASPPLDLRQGAFAARSKSGLDRALLRRWALLAASIVALTLALPFAQAWRINRAAAALEQDGAAQAQAIDPALSDDSAINARLAAIHGGGAGFLPTYAAIAASLGNAPGVTLGGLRFDTGGTLTATVRAPNDGAVAALAAGLRTRGFSVTVNPSAENQGKRVADLMVTG